MYTVQLDYIEGECTRYVDSLYVHCTARLYRKRMYYIFR